MVGKLVGKSRSHVANLLRLLELPDGGTHNAVARRYQHGPCPGHRHRAGPRGLAKEIVDGDLSVRQAEHLAKKVRPGAGQDIGRASARNYRARSTPIWRRSSASLSDLLGIRVKVSHGKSGGSVALHYSTLDQLDLICQRLSGEPI